MNKEIAICVGIVIFVIILNYITINFTNNTVEIISKDLEEFKTTLLKEDAESKEIKDKNDDIMKKWREKYDILAYFIEHDELEKVETELTALEASIEVEEYEDGIENLDRCIFILNHIKDKYSMSIENIF